MDSLEDLLERAKKLNSEFKFVQVEELLNDQVLDLHKNADLYVEKAQALWRLSKYKMCDEVVEKALILSPQNAMANHYKGNSHAIQKEYEKAILYFERALMYDPNLKLSFNGLANIYYLKNDFEKAVIYYRKTIEIDPEFAHAYNGLGNIYCAQKKYSKGLEYLEKARDLDPKEPSYYNNLGVAYQNQKKYEKASKYYEKAISVDPNYIDSYINLGDMCVDEKKYIEAKKYYQNAIDLKPDGRDYDTLRTKGKLSNTEKRLSNIGFDQLSDLVNKIKKILLFDEDCVTHYTSLNVAKLLILSEGNFLRLSEGTYLNDPSEGSELFKLFPSFADVKDNLTLSETISKSFVQKPFIGSYVPKSKKNDLTLWRMYGKDNKEEATGCSITLDRFGMLEAIKRNLLGKTATNDGAFHNEANPMEEDFNFYRVAYRRYNDAQFIVPGLNSSDENNLNKHMSDLKIKVKKYTVRTKKTEREIQEIKSLLSDIAYLFKTVEYLFENEVRLVVNGSVFDKLIDIESNPPKVCVKLANINPLINQLTLGPKMDRSDEWAAVFYYHLDKKGYHPEITISHLPFK